MDLQVLPPPQHQVFINFRGDELRNKFISHLVDAFQRNNINYFIDKKEQKGEEISNLFKRIEQSKIAIAVFSTRYTESRWCLDELVKIKERVDLGKLKVLPIFYNISTDHVKRIEGDFGTHFRDLERMYQYEKPKIDKWKEAIASVSGKIGLTFDDKSSSESDFIGNVIEDILTMLQSIPSLQVQNSLINTLPIKEETSTMNKDSKVENSLINTLPIEEETPTLKKDSKVEDSLINILPIKEESCTMKKDSKVENSLINTLPIKEETSTMKKDSKKHLKAQKGNLEPPPRAIPYGYGPRPSEHEPITVTFSQQACPANNKVVQSSNKSGLNFVRPSYDRQTSYDNSMGRGEASSKSVKPSKRNFFNGWIS